MAEKKKTNWKDEIILISKVIAAVTVISTVLGGAVWNLMAKDMVNTQIDVKMERHVKEVLPQVEEIKTNSGDINQNKTNIRYIVCALDEMMKPDQKRAAKEKHAQWERMQ